MKRALPTLVAALACLAACDATVPTGPPLQGAQQALFADYPTGLFADAARACTRTGGKTRQHDRDDLLCEQLPDPQLAAALILHFDGTIEDLPSLNTRIYGAPAVQGYVVTVDNYIDMPGRDGRTRQIRLPSEGLDESMRAMLQRSGGRPF